MSKKIEPFKFWAHKIMPLVYDDSLSYYEVLCKVVAKLNEVVEYINGNVSKLIKEILAQALFGALYIEDEECIVLQSDLIQVGDGVHTFDPTTKTMSISDEE